MAQLVGDILLLIFTELHDDIPSLRSCILVNTTWCHIAVPLLWKYISDAYENPLNHKPESREKLYNVIAHFLPNNPEDPLPQNNIILPLNKFQKSPTFEYMNFFTRLTTVWIEDMAELLINDEVDNSKHKKKILEREIYNLIFNKCNNAKYFHWYTKKKLYRYPNSKTFFSNLRSLEYNFEAGTSKTLSKLAEICQNLKNLEINDCDDEDIPGLVSFIKVQKNLQSLCLHFDNVEEKYTLLSNIIKKKAASLKKLIINPIITLIPPIFIPSLKNIQYLALNNEYHGELYESVKWRDWEHNLCIASFPYLQHLEALYLPSNIICSIIEKSGMNILEINIRCPLKSNDYQSENKKLIKVISSCCPKLIRLTMNVDHNNLSEMGKIFSNCTQLEKIYLTTNVEILPNGDELLRVMNKVSPTTLKEFSFIDKWNFSLKGLESFFENWKYKNRSPIKFIHYYDELDYTWTENHDKMVEKYKNERVVR